MTTSTNVGGRVVPALLVIDMDETIAFYQRLGFDLSACHPDATAPTWAERRRELGQALNGALSSWTDLAGACAAARAVAQIAAHHEEEKRVASDAAYVVRTALRVREGCDDADAKQSIINRLAQLRFVTEARNPRGLYLLTCHESKGKEFDMVILPYVSKGIFPDGDEEACQLRRIGDCFFRILPFLRSEDKGTGSAAGKGATTAPSPGPSGSALAVFFQEVVHQGLL